MPAAKEHTKTGNQQPVTAIAGSSQVAQINYTLRKDRMKRAVPKARHFSGSSCRNKVINTARE